MPPCCDSAPTDRNFWFSHQRGCIPFLFPANLGHHPLILQRPALNVVAEASDPLEMVSAAGRLDPDVMVVDLSILPDESERPRALFRRAPRGGILAVAPTRDIGWRRRASSLGAAGFVTRQDAATVFLDAIERAARPAGDTRVIGQDSTASTSAEPLSNREADVARLVCKGLRNEEIGRELFISEATVRHHLTEIFAKRHVASRAQLIVDAHRSGFLGA